MKAFLILSLGFAFSCSHNSGRKIAGDFDHDAGTSPVVEAVSTNEEAKPKQTLIQVSSPKEVLILAGTGASGCPQKHFAISKSVMRLSAAMGFCDALNKTQKHEGYSWELTDTRPASDLRIDCGLENFVEQNEDLKKIFPTEKARSRLLVWHNYPPAAIRNYPHPVTYYPLKQTPAYPEMENGRVVEPDLLPALCTLYKNR